MDEINGRIQLPYGFLENYDENKINLDLPRNFKKSYCLKIYVLLHN